MQRTFISSVIILGATLSVVSTAYAQQAADATQAPPATATSTATAPTAAPSATSTPAAAAPAASSTTNASTTPATPSTDTLKKARKAGYYTRVRKGQTFFCKKAPQLGTRFESENCISEEQLAMTLEREEAQRDQLRNVTCGGGGSCGGGK
jgi:hypothetical protein